MKSLIVAMGKGGNDSEAPMDVSADQQTEGDKGGITQYYHHKIEQLELTIADKKQNLRRLEAQRNEWNCKGTPNHRKCESCLP